MVGLRGNRRVQANAIVGDVPAECFGAQAGTRYDAVRGAPGGVFSSICGSSYGSALTNLGGPDLATCTSSSWLSVRATSSLSRLSGRRSPAPNGATLPPPAGSPSSPTLFQARRRPLSGSRRVDPDLEERPTGLPSGWGSASCPRRCPLPDSPAHWPLGGRIRPPLGFQKKRLPGRNRCFS